MTTNRVIRVVLKRYRPLNLNRILQKNIYIHRISILSNGFSNGIFFFFDAVGRRFFNTIKTLLLFIAPIQNELNRLNAVGGRGDGWPKHSSNCVHYWLCGSRKILRVGSGLKKIRARFIQFWHWIFNSVDVNGLSDKKVAWRLVDAVTFAIEYKRNAYVRKIITPNPT